MTTSSPLQSVQEEQPERRVQINDRGAKYKPLSQRIMARALALQVERRRQPEHCSHATRRVQIL